MSGSFHTIKSRADFLKVRGGLRMRCDAFVIEGKLRDHPTGADDEASVRFGFTVTKKLGNAVARNRIKRRLRHAVRASDPANHIAGFDYVIVAYENSATAVFAGLVSDLDGALANLQERFANGERTSKRRPRKAAAKPGSQSR